MFLHELLALFYSRRVFTSRENTERLIFFEPLGVMDLKMQWLWKSLPLLIIKFGWLNPFSLEHGKLVSLSTAVEAPPEVAMTFLKPRSTR